MKDPESITRENLWDYIKEVEQAELDKALFILAEPLKTAGIEIVGNLASIAADDEVKHWLYISADEFGVNLDLSMVRALETLGVSHLFWQEVYEHSTEH